VATAEGEEQVIGGSDLQVLAAPSLGLRFGLAESRDVDDLLERPPVFAVLALGEAEAVGAVRPHAIADIDAGSHVRLELADAFRAVRVLDLRPFRLDEDPGVGLGVVGSFVEDDDIGPFTGGPDLDRELGGAVGRRVLVLPDEGFLAVLPDVLLGSVLDEPSREGVRDLAVRNGSDRCHGRSGHGRH